MQWIEAIVDAHFVDFASSISSDKDGVVSAILSNVFSAVKGVGDSISSLESLLGRWTHVHRAALIAATTDASGMAVTNHKSSAAYTVEVLRI
jgi:hypothetical protein